MAGNLTTPDWRAAYNVQPGIRAYNDVDNNENPTGGTVRLDTEPVDEDSGTLPAMFIRWQDGPRAIENSDELLPPNGAFIEDVLWAALQRLEYFNSSKYRSRQNSVAITHLEGALQALKDRQLERSYRGVEGQHKV